MKYSEEFVRKQWYDFLDKVDKYFNKPVVCNDNDKTIREFIISQKKEWAFDLLARVVCNYDVKEFAFVGFHQISFRKGARLTGAYKNNDGTIYSIHTQPYLNGNTRVVVKIEKRMS